MMWSTLTRSKAIGIWTAAVLTVLGIVVPLQILPLSFATSLLLAIALIVPPSVMVMVWRGAPPPTVAETLEAVNRRP
jgi:hypothetical protein